MKAAGLFLCHLRSARVAAHFERLKAETRDLVDWHELYNPGNGAQPQVAFEYLPARRSMVARYREFRYNGGVQRGLMDVAILPVAAALRAEFVWALEYDVDFSGHWSRLFEQFSDNRADLLTTTLRPLGDCPDWPHWRTARPPADVSPEIWHRAFHPIMRLSRPFLLWYIEEMSRRRWHGHYEYTLPTSALWKGFRVEDLGGTGPLCPPARHGRNYTKAPGQSDRGEGTLVWRPFRDAYWTEAPESFGLPEMLYHPIKTEAPDWLVARPGRARRWLRRLERWRFRH